MKDFFQTLLTIATGIDTWWHELKMRRMRKWMPVYDDICLQVSLMDTYLSQVRSADDLLPIVVPTLSKLEGRYPERVFPTCIVRAAADRIRLVCDSADLSQHWNDNALSETARDFHQLREMADKVIVHLNHRPGHKLQVVG